MAFILFLCFVICTIVILGDLFKNKKRYFDIVGFGGTPTKRSWRQWVGIFSVYRDNLLLASWCLYLKPCNTICQLFRSGA